MTPVPITVSMYDTTPEASCDPSPSTLSDVLSHSNNSSSSLETADESLESWTPFKQQEEDELLYQLDGTGFDTVSATGRTFLSLHWTASGLAQASDLKHDRAKFIRSLNQAILKFESVSRLTSAQGLGYADCCTRDTVQAQRKEREAEFSHWLEDNMPQKFGKSQVVTEQVDAFLASINQAYLESVTTDRSADERLTTLGMGLDSVHRLSSYLDHTRRTHRRQLDRKQKDAEWQSRLLGRELSLAEDKVESLQDDLAQTRKLLCASLWCSPSLLIDAMRRAGYFNSQLPQRRS